MRSGWLLALIGWFFPTAIWAQMPYGMAPPNGFPPGYPGRNSFPQPLPYPPYPQGPVRPGYPPPGYAPGGYAPRGYAPQPGMAQAPRFPDFRAPGAPWGMPPAGAGGYYPIQAQPSPGWTPPPPGMLPPGQDPNAQPMTPSPQQQGLPPPPPPPPQTWEGPPPKPAPLSPPSTWEGPPPMPAQPSPPGSVPGQPAPPGQEVPVPPTQPAAPPPFEGALPPPPPPPPGTPGMEVPPPPVVGSEPPPPPFVGAQPPPHPEVDGIDSAVVAVSDPPCGGPGLVLNPRCFQPAVPLWDGSHTRRMPKGQKFYGSADYLYYWLQRPSAPRLLTITPPGGPTTTIGGGQLDFFNPQFQGARLTLGGWLNRYQTIGLEASFFFLAQQTSTFAISSDGSTVLARPFINAITGVSDQVIIAQPGTSGSSTIDYLSRIWGGELNSRWQIKCGCGYHLDFLFGGRVLRFDEALNVNDSSTTAGVTTNRFDSFGTHNTFYAGQIGLDSEVHYGRVFVDGFAKFAMGSNEQVVIINGGTTTAGVGTPGSVLAQPTNIGHYTRAEFAVMPEVGVSVGARVAKHFRVAVGYSLLYINRVVRPGEQIDPMVNPNQNPLIGPARPRFQFVNTEFYMHGANLQVEWKF